MVLLDVLGQRWALRILWELQSGAATFRDLQARCDGLSPTVLNTRLKDLRALALVDLTESGYALSDKGQELATLIAPLDTWATKWAQETFD